MDGMRQMDQLEFELTLSTGPKGEAPRTGEQGPEPSTTKSEPKSPADTSPHFSPGFVARVRKGGAGKARRTIRPQACFLHSEDRTVRRNADGRRFYGLAAGSW